MCHLQFRNLFLFSPAILGFCKVLYVSNLSWAHVCVLTVHAQCTYSARTVRGHSARAGNAANTTENSPYRLQNKEKQVSGYLISFHVISTDNVLFTPFTARALWRALRCTVRALSKHTHSACSSLLLLHWLLEHPREPWCCAVLAAAICLLVSLCARTAV